MLLYAYDVRTSREKAAQYLADASPLQLLLLGAKGQLLGTAAGTDIPISLFFFIATNLMVNVFEGELVIVRHHYC